MTYLITGITGFLGRALTDALLTDPATVRVAGFSRDEHKVAAFQAQYPDPRVDVWVGDVRDRARVRDALAIRPDVVIHAAAMKRVERCEADPEEALKTNVLGTWTVARAARLAGVPRVLVVSSDKATSPETCYGVTKAMAEHVALGQNAYRRRPPTRISVVRYGNILGSTGSFLETLLRARHTGDVVEITDPASTRFWWHVEDAVAFIRLVLARMQGAEIFVPQLPNASVVDLARAIAPASSHVVVGMRGSEKTHEAMISPTEASYTYALPGYYVLLPKQGQPWSPAPPVGAVKVPAGFSYASHHQLQTVTFEELRESPPCYVSPV